MDQSDEWQRLRELYACMNEGELEVVANEAYDLTDVARPLLKDEIARRGLKIQLLTERPKRGAAPVLSTGFDPSKLDLVVARTFWTQDAARSAKAFLTEAGIPCYFGPDNVETVEDLKCGFDDGVDLTVREEDYSRVVAALAQLIPREQLSGEEDFSIDCPKCHSPEIMFHDVDEGAKYSWSCDACGHEWKDDGVV
jgi:DNA-directed RNA polymerase subunit M/transcription elongation factor TFIIS